MNFGAASYHIPGGATPPARSCRTARAISSERPNSWMSAVLRSASPTSVLVRVPSAATRNLRFLPIVRIEPGKWRVMKRASLKNPALWFGRGLLVVRRISAAKAFAKKNGGRTAKAILIGFEVAADEGFNSQRIEEFRGDKGAL